MSFKITFYTAIQLTNCIVLFVLYLKGVRSLKGGNA